jgi:hypothetical protein
MNQAKFNTLLSRTAKIGLCVSAGGYALFGASMPPEANAAPIQAAHTANDALRVANYHLYDAFGRVECEGGKTVEEIFVVSFPDKYKASIKRVGKTSVESFNVGTDDPLFTVHVDCKDLDQADISHITFADKEDDFLCYTKPNVDNIPIDRCEADPALG